MNQTFKYKNITIIKCVNFVITYYCNGTSVVLGLQFFALWIPRVVGMLYVMYGFLLLYVHLFIHSIGMCRMRRFIAILMSFFHSSLLCTFSCHPSPPTILTSSLTSSYHLFLGLPLNFLFPNS